MKVMLRCATAFACLALSCAQAGEQVKICHDERGNPTFTDTSCGGNTAAERSMYVPNAQGYNRRFSSADVRMLNQAEQRRDRERAAHYAPLHTSPWAEAQAAKNAMNTIRAEREMYRHRNNGPRDAAETAIEYNAEVIANGGTHQVRVPDVTRDESAYAHRHYYGTAGKSPKRTAVRPQGRPRRTDGGRLEPPR